jgi:hypothetical protein
MPGRYSKLMKPLKSYPSLTVESLRALRGYSLTQLLRTPGKIPHVPGVYIWRYWPSFKSLEREDFLQVLANWQQRQPSFTETIRGSRIEASITRRPFGLHDNKTIFGIDTSSSKGQRFLQAIEESQDNRALLAELLDCIACLSPPLYVGKADNLRGRLQDHLDRKTHVLAAIDEQGLQFDDVYVSFIEDPVSTTNTSVTTALEEILQRLTNPPMTKRIG